MLKQMGRWHANEDTESETAPARRLGERVPEPSPCALLERGIYTIEENKNRADLLCHLAE